MGEHVMCERARQAHEGEDNVLVLARLPFYLERNRTFKARNSFYAPKYNFSPEDWLSGRSESRHHVGERFFSC